MPFHLIIIAEVFFFCLLVCLFVCLFCFVLFCFVLFFSFSSLILIVPAVDDYGFHKKCFELPFKMNHSV